MTTKETATRWLREAATADVVEAAESAVEAGTHEWLDDPSVEGVVGLVDVGTNRARIVIYFNEGLEGDFEVDEEWMYGQQ